MFFVYKVKNKKDTKNGEMIVTFYNPNLVQLPIGTNISLSGNNSFFFPAAAQYHLTEPDKAILILSVPG